VPSLENISRCGNYNSVEKMETFIDKSLNIAERRGGV